MAHAVESHPQRKYIIEALTNGVPLRKLAATLDPPIYFTSLQRYKLAMVKPALRNAHALAQVLAKSKTISDEDLQQITATTAAQAIQAQPVIQPYLARIAKHQETIDSAIVNAQADQDGRTAAALIATDLKGMELHARLNHCLDAPAGPAIAIQIVVPTAAQVRTGPADDGDVVDIG